MGAAFSPREYLVMAKPVGPRCNLDCVYCYYKRKEALFAPDQPRLMPDVLLESFIVQRLNSSSSQAAVHFEWHGGEPTLAGLDFYRKVVGLQHRHARPGQKVTNGMQTNGLLVDDNWASFFASEGFSVGLSLDGTAAMHDPVRPTLAGLATHRKVLRALQLLQRRRVHTDILCVLSAGNVDQPMAVYDFFKEIGVTFLQFLPLVEPLDGTMGGVNGRSADPYAFGAFLCAVFDRWISHDLGRMVIQNFDEALRPFLGLPHALCVFAESCGNVIVLEHDGAVYACDHFVNPTYCLGNLGDRPLSELAADQSLLDFGRLKREGLPRFCLECDVLAWCNGGCPKDRFAQSPDGEPGVNYLCPAFKRFFAHCRPVMERLAVHWQKGLDLAAFAAMPREASGTGVTQAGRNEACPCGSGRKYKKCCLLSRDGR